MSRIHDALKQAQTNADRPATPGPKETVVPPRPAAEAKLEQPAEVKQAPRLLPKKKRSTPSGSSLLFHRDPEENVKQWMQNYFPDGLLSREDAIQQWLARPLESRVQTFVESPVESEQSSAAEILVEGKNEVQSVQASNGNSKHRSEWNSQLILTGSHSESAQSGGKQNSGKEGPHSDGSRDIAKMLFKYALYSCLTLLIIGALWTVSTGKVVSHADSWIAAIQPHSTGIAAAADPPAPQGQTTAQAQLDLASQPSRIESLSIGCDEARPCIEIGTQGKEIDPRLSTLTDPDRLVLDFQDAVYSPDIRPLDVGRGAVKSVRIGDEAAAQLSGTRVVIDLTARCDYQLETLPDKFVLNVYPKATVRPTE